MVRWLDAWRNLSSIWFMVHVCACTVWLFTTPWTVACQTPLSMGLSRQECWSGLPFLPPGDLSNLTDWTSVSCGFCIGRWILYHWATWEALIHGEDSINISGLCYYYYWTSQCPILPPSLDRTIYEQSVKFRPFYFY